MGRGSQQEGQGKARVVIPFMGRNVCPSREPDCLRGQGWELALTCIMIRIHLEIPERDRGRTSDTTCTCEEMER